MVVDSEGKKLSVATTDSTTASTQKEDTGKSTNENLAEVIVTLVIVTATKHIYLYMVTMK